MAWLLVLLSIWRGSETAWPLLRTLSGEGERQHGMAPPLVWHDATPPPPPPLARGAFLQKRQHGGFGGGVGDVVGEHGWR